MLRIVVMVGTRKGCFLLESDEARRDWEIRGPFCEGWPIYHAVHDACPATIYAAAASEWHGSAIWRTRDLGATWEHSSEGLTYGEGGELKLSKVSGPGRGARPAAGRREAAGIFESRDGGADLLAAVDARRPARGATSGTSRRTSRRATSACPACSRIRTIRPRFCVVVQGFGDLRDDGRRRDVDAAQPRACAPSGRATHPEVGFCVHKLVMAPDRERLYQQNHCGMHRSDDQGRSWTEITEGLPSDFGFAAAAHPHDRDALLRDPARPRPRALHARGPGRRLAHARRRLELAAARSRACPSATRSSACCARGWRSTTSTTPGLYFGTSTGPAVRERRRGRDVERDRELPAGDRVGRGRGPGLARWPTSTSRRRCRRCSRGLPRRLDVEAGDGRRGDRRGSTRAGRACATGCASRARRCAATSTSSSTASGPSSTRRSRRLARRRDRGDQRRLNPPIRTRGPLLAR